MSASNANHRARFIVVPLLLSLWLSVAKGATTPGTFVYYTDTDNSGCVGSTGACHKTGELWKAIDGKGRATTFVKYDDHRRVIRMQRANNELTDVVYDDSGRIQKLTFFSEDGLTTKGAEVFSYDAAGNVVKVAHADGSYFSYTYSGHVLTDITGQNGNKIHFMSFKHDQDSLSPNANFNRAVARENQRLGTTIKLLYMANRSLRKDLRPLRRLVTQSLLPNIVVQN